MAATHNFTIYIRKVQRISIVYKEKDASSLTKAEVFELMVHTWFPGMIFKNISLGKPLANQNRPATKWNDYRDHQNKN